MAKKIDSTLRNMVLSLTFISMVMSAALTLVYLQTKEPIAAAAKQKEMGAIKLVSPEFNSDPTSGALTIDGVTVYPLKNQDIPAGYAVKTYTDKGFSGHIELMAGFLPDGSIVDITVLQHKETPGLGTKMAEEKFLSQFRGKNPSSFLLKVGLEGDVDAITAATISSRAFCDALQRAYDALNAKDSVNLKP